jgi:hypothetical protein
MPVPYSSTSKHPPTCASDSKKRWVITDAELRPSGREPTPTEERPRARPLPAAATAVPGDWRGRAPPAVGDTGPEGPEGNSKHQVITILWVQIHDLAASIIHKYTRAAKHVSTQPRMQLTAAAGGIPHYTCTPRPAPLARPSPTWVARGWSIE